MNAKKLLACLLIILTVLLAACGSTALKEPVQTTEAETGLKVHFLDVGQADCILIQAPTGENMLIDAGNNDDADTIISYLNAQGVRRIDVLVGTHPHEDHIGSLDTVIDTYDIGKVYMPRVTHTTKTFEDVLIAIKNKGLKIAAAKAGEIIDFSPNTRVEILAPNSPEYDDLNNYSAVIKLTYGNTSFLFTGDAEDISENEMLASGYDLKADVLKLGHHGSSTSSTEAFLAAVKPSYGVISVGKGNDYGHPHEEVLTRLEQAGIEIYRTDESGTVLFATDGDHIEIKTEKAGRTAKDVTVYITKTGKKYHMGDCNLLKDSRVPIKLSEAKTRGYEPCKSCKPPQ
ncbi:MAG: ComEC/Rec2 family competence protein [Tepidanaerobacteraceae bacterium]